jgi:hypothetical protein
MTLQESPEYYQPSGYVEVTRLVVLSCMALVCCLALAVLMYLVYVSGYYYVIFVPVVFSLSVMVLVDWTLKHSHCRNRMIGGGLGMLAAIFLYLGSFHAGLVHMGGFEQIHRVDLLPSYIASRMKTDVVDDAPAPQYAPGDNSTDTPDSGRTWIVFAVEFSLCVFMSGTLGFSRGGKPYCEKCKAWMRQDLEYFPKKTGPAIIEALQTGNAAVICRMPRVPFQVNNSTTTVAVEHCEVGGALGIDKTGDESCPVYIGVKAVRAAGLMKLTRFDFVVGRTLLRRRRMSQTEMIGLAPVFPSLKRHTKPKAASPSPLQG